MSTIVAANISDGTDSTPTGYAVNGSAKMTAEVDSSFTLTLGLNVSSITDLGVGLASINLTNALTTAGAHASTAYGASRIASCAAPTTTTAPYSLYTAANALLDIGFGAAAFGELA